MFVHTVANKRARLQAAVDLFVSGAITGTFLESCAEVSSSARRFCENICASKDPSLCCHPSFFLLLRCLFPSFLRHVPQPPQIPAQRSRSLGQVLNRLFFRQSGVRPHWERRVSFSKKTPLMWMENSECCVVGKKKEGLQETYINLKNRVWTDLVWTCLQYKWPKKPSSCWKLLLSRFNLGFVMIKPKIQTVAERRHWSKNNESKILYFKVHYFHNWTSLKLAAAGMKAFKNNGIQSVVVLLFLCLGGP